MGRPRTRPTGAAEEEEEEWGGGLEWGGRTEMPLEGRWWRGSSEESKSVSVWEEGAVVLLQLPIESNRRLNLSERTVVSVGETEVLVLTEIASCCDC